MMRIRDDIMAEQPYRSAPSVTGRHVLFGMIAFFAVTMGVNGVMVYAALTTFAGIETSDAYRRGLAYNRRIAEGEQQSGSGWSDRVDVADDPPRLRVAIRGRDGRPLTGLIVRARIGRPATDRYDRDLTLAEAAPGDYASPLEAVGAGSWVADIRVAQNGKESETIVFRARRRLWLKP
jgi:nitrogen fixation protein FixH